MSGKTNHLLNQFKSSIILRRAPGARDPEINPVEPRKVKMRIFMRQIWLLTDIALLTFLRLGRSVAK